jgi:hypothetical protein
MEAKPKRIQLKRTKGWKMPTNTVAVTRPGKFGNPFTITAAIESEYATKETAQRFVVDCFRDWIGPSQSGRDWWQGPRSTRKRIAILSGLESLRGKNLACWCKPGEPCHADVLLEIANR